MFDLFSSRFHLVIADDLDAFLADFSFGLGYEETGKDAILSLA